MTRFTPTPITQCLLLAAALCSSTGKSDAADMRFWTLTPYEIELHLAVESQVVPAKQLSDQVATHLQQRADASIGAIWNLRVAVLTGNARSQALRGYSEQERLDLAEASERKLDKVIVVTVKESPQGFFLSAIESDPLLQRSSERLVSGPYPLSAVPEAAFALMLDAFQPLAVFDLDKKTGGATISFRGSQLPRKPGAPDWGQPGDILLPVLRRTDREGSVAENGIQAAPWTYLEITEPAVGKEGAVAILQSHSKRPFGGRRRGRTEYYALLLHNSGMPTRLHLHVRDTPETPLAGYEAYAQDGADGTRNLIGVSDANGIIEVPAGESPIQMVYIKSGSQLVAKTPAPVGAVSQIDVPLLDERQRLEAEAKISLLQEEIVDLVARRNILAARIRKAIKDKKIDAAQALLDELDGMPGQRQFEQKLNRMRQQARSSDKVVQKRIDKLFNDTAIVLGAFLTTTEADKLRSELSKLR